MAFKGTPRFGVRRRLGEGGMGVVYEAYDRRRGTEVALKTLRDLEASALYRFKKEFRSLANIAHPNLVSLYELFNTGDTWFFTMELLEGTDFLRYVRPGPALEPERTLRERPISETAEEEIPMRGLRVLPALDEDRLREALGQLVTGVHALHEAGRLHRDFKPNNVMVTDSGRLVILDFGLVAELHRGKEFQSTLKHIVGTAGYMSPEQGMGEGIGPASDWYAVGAMLFEALVGRRPFLGRPMDVIITKQRREAPAPRELDPKVPADLDLLVTRLLKRRPSERPTGAEILRSLGLSTQRRDLVYVGTDVVPQTLVGRSRELASLRAGFEEARGGRATTVLIGGASGLGKSVLVDTFLEELTPLEDAVVLRGGCYEREAVPFKAFDDLVDGLSRFLRSLVVADVEAILPEHIVSLARVFPVLRQVRAIHDSVVAEEMRSGQSRPDGPQVRRAAFTALRDLLGALCRRLPVVLAIDDLHWGDEDSADLFAEILRGPDPPPVMLIATYRSEDEGTSPLLGALATVAKAGGRLRRIELEPLREVETEALALELLRSPDIRGDDEERAAAARSIAREARGSPFFVVELVTHLLDGGNAAEVSTIMEQGARRQQATYQPGFDTADLTLDQVLRSRIELLPPPARRLLSVVAVSGFPVPQTIALDAAGLGQHQELALSLLLSSNLIRSRSAEREPDLTVYHERIRRAVVGLMDPSSISAVHRTIAVALELAPEPDAELMAFHLSRAGDITRAAGYALRAARDAHEKLALERSSRLYRLALKGSNLSNAVKKEAANVFLEAGQGLEAAELLEALAETADNREELLRVAADQLLRTGHVDRGVELLERVLAEHGMSLAGSRTGQLTRLARARLNVRLRGLRYRRQSATLVDRRELERIDLLWAVATGMGMVDTIASSDFQARHLVAALDAGEPERLVRALAMEACYLAASGSGAERRTKKLVAMAEQIAWDLASERSMGLASMARGASAFLFGRFADGARVSKLAEDTFRDHCSGAQWEIATSGIFRLLSLAMLGRLRELNRYVRERVPETRARGDRYAAANLRSGLGNLAWLVGDDAKGAEAVLDETLTHLPSGGFKMPHAYEVLARCNVLLYRGEAQQAFRRFEEIRRPYEKSLVPRVQFLRIEMTFLRGRTALAAGRIPLVLQASSALEKEAVSYAQALARLLKAGAIEAEGSREEAGRAYGAAARSLHHVDMALHAAAAQRRQGLLTASTRGHEAVKKADRWLEGQGLSDPIRFASIFAPHP